MITINELPPEILIHIFSFLPPESDECVARVCQQWYAALRVRLVSRKEHEKIELFDFLSSEKIINSDTIMHAAHVGNLPAVKFLEQKYGIDYYVVLNACHGGHLPVLQYLRDRRVKVLDFNDCKRIARNRGHILGFLGIWQFEVEGLPTSIDLFD